MSRQIVIKIPVDSVAKVDMEISKARIAALAHKSFDSTVCPAYTVARPVLRLLAALLPLPVWSAAIKGLMIILDAECKISSK